MLTQGLMKTEYGNVSVDRSVIASYAGSVAVSSFGIVGMAAVNVRDGLVRLLKKDYLSHGIEVEIDNDNGIYLTFHVIASYGSSIASVADNLRESVRYRLEAFTGMKVMDIKILVEGIRVID